MAKVIYGCMNKGLLGNIDEVLHGNIEEVLHGHIRDVWLGAVWMRCCIDEGYWGKVGFP